MTERVCGNCRWFRRDDLCWRYPKENATLPDATCGEWSDKNITPEQDERQKLTEKFAVAIVNSSLHSVPDVWAAAAELAAANPRWQLSR